jgi:hypothetical protein
VKRWIEGTKKLNVKTGKIANMPSFWLFTVSALTNPDERATMIAIQNFRVYIASFGT